MARRRTRQRTVFLPWERQGGLVRRLGLGRARPFAVLLGVVALFGGLSWRERRRAGVRATQATILAVRARTDIYLAEHRGHCPAGGLPTMVEEGYLANNPLDAWGRPLRLLCPARRTGRAYDLFSDGPDGRPGGLDRIE